MNPLVSWAVWVVDQSELSYLDSTLYITLQYLGGLLGGWFCLRCTGATFYFQPVPPYPPTAAFFAETFYGGILCLTALGMPDIHGRGSILSDLFNRGSTNTLSLASLSHIDEDGVTLRSHTKTDSIKLTGRKRAQSLSSIMVLKGLIFGTVTAVLTFWCKGVSGGSLNPAICWGASASHLMKHGLGSVDFWLFVPYSLGPYVAATVAGVLYRLFKRRSTRGSESFPAGSQVSCASCREDASLLKSSGIPCAHWASDHAG